MRALPLLSLLLLFSGCDDDEEDTTFTDVGGTLEVDGCGDRKAHV